jgi:hypothetical protein
MLIVAADPGSNGGITSIQTNGVTADRMPDTRTDVVDLLRDLGKESDGKTLYVERLVKFTGTNMPGSAMAVYAQNHGILVGAAIALGYRLVEVPPKEWQKKLGLGSKGTLSTTQWKNKLKERAQDLYPAIKVTLATADALLILEAARRGLLG